MIFHPNNKRENSGETAAEEARKIGAKSPCQKSQRGVVLVTAHGFMMGACNAIPIVGCLGRERCGDKCAKVAVHAEERVLLMAGQMAQDSEIVHLKVMDGLPVASGPPSCAQCSRLMLSAGVAGVWLLHDKWTRYTAIDFHRRTLENCGLPGAGMLR